MSAEERPSPQRAKLDAAARTRNLRIVIVALMLLVTALGLVARRDGISRVIPDLWSSARTLLRMIGATS
ncbi:hypothetical protein SAMN05519104_1123 [Rhizobiales bacterium GAS188]|jgi:hypothetical protein|nr:hypothetical protein SAMN05519104_1123 [Rhizobiales bacterium GAS188]